MNRKGITLVEIIISVGLISVVMIFLFRLLTDMQYEQNHASYAKDNQLVRAEVIKKVQEDFQNLKLQDITINAGKNVITFVFANNVRKNLTLTANSFQYNGQESWNIVSSNNDTRIDIGNVRIEKNLKDSRCTDSAVSGISCSSYYSLRVVIPIVNSSKANIIDDVEFFYIGHY